MPPGVVACASTSAGSAALQRGRFGHTGSGQPKQRSNPEAEKWRALATKFGQSMADVVRDEVAAAKNTSDVLMAAREMLALADCNQDAYARLDKYLAQHQAINERLVSWSSRHP